MKNARNRRLVLASGLCAFVLSAACGSGEKSAPTPPAAPLSATENAINPVPRDRVQDGGKLTWVLDAIPPNFNYHELDGTLYDNHEFMWGMLPHAYLPDASGTPIWSADLFSSEPQLATNPKQVVTFQINPKAKWSDGAPITWQDFYWQWEATNGQNKAYRISASQGYEDIENVERGTSDREVVVTFARPFGDWRSLYDPLYPASTNRDPKVFNDGWKARPLTSAGPFKFASLDPTAKTLTLVRDDQWWGNRAKLDSITYRALDINAQIDALANGEIDFKDLASDANANRRAQTIPDVEIRTAGGPNWTHLTLNGNGPVLRDVIVRRALAMGVDRTTIAKALLGPLGIDPQILNNHIFMRNQRGYQDNSGDVGKFDQARAAQLLEEAGWKLDGAVRKKEGRPLEISFIIPTAVATSRQISELVQNMLGKIGFKVSITAVPLGDFFSKYVTPGQFDITLFSWVGTAYPVSSVKSIFVKPTKGASGELDVRQNFGRIGTDEIDRLISAATQELDSAAKIERANQVDAAVWREVHSIPLYQRPERYAVKKGLANFGAKGFAEDRYEDIGWAK